MTNDEAIGVLQQMLSQSDHDAWCNIKGEYLHCRDPEALKVAIEALREKQNSTNKTPVDLELLRMVIDRLAHIQRCEMRAANVFGDESRRFYQARWACYMRIIQAIDLPDALQEEAKRLGIQREVP